MCNIMCAIANFRHVHDKNVASAWIDFSRLRFFFSLPFAMKLRAGLHSCTGCLTTFNLKFNDSFPVDVSLKRSSSRGTDQCLVYISSVLYIKYLSNQALSSVILRNQTFMFYSRIIQSNIVNILLFSRDPKAASKRGQRTADSQWLMISKISVCFDVSIKRKSTPKLILKRI